MDAYLIKTLHNLKTKNFLEINIVIGNESCDLDSALSSIVYSTFLFWQHEQIKCKVCTRKPEGASCKDNLFVPILNVNREDFQLKTEVAFCLAELGINEDMLVFRNDYNLSELLNSVKTNITLVDHHTLSCNDALLAPFVKEIIDHRPIDKSNWNYADDTRVTIETVGSCCTLVAQRIKDLSAIMGKGDQFFNEFQVCCDLLHCGIVLDTGNFSKVLNKATSHDIDISSFLESILEPTNCEENRKCKLERLLAARTDVSQLNAEQLLKKDTKFIGPVMVPSFPILVTDFLSRPDATLSLRNSLRSKGNRVALLLGMQLATTSEAQLERDVAIFSEKNEMTTALSNFLQKWTTPTFHLSTQPAPDNMESVLYFRQLNLCASRKQFIPAVNEFIKINNL